MVFNEKNLTALPFCYMVRIRGLYELLYYHKIRRKKVILWRNLDFFGRLRHILMLYYGAISIFL